MNEQEAAAWVERFWRVWRGHESDNELEYELRTYHLYFTCRLDANATLYAYVPWTAQEVFPPNVTLQENDEELGCYMDCYSTQGTTLERVPEPSPVEFGHSLLDMPHRDEDLHLFVAKWMEVFRRGCWLSGCPIEATAHEKAEWMQGFTQEELETWNLKF